MEVNDVKIEIKKRDRDYGIIIWPAVLDISMKNLFNHKEDIDLILEDKSKIKRKVLYKYRKISIGKKKIPTSSKFFNLRKSKNGIELTFD